MNTSKVQVTFDVTDWSAPAVQKLLEMGNRLGAGTAPASTPAVAPATSNSVPSSWTPALVEHLIDRVLARGGITQARSIRYALDNGGHVDRATILGFSDRSDVQAFTVKIRNSVIGMQEDNLLDAAVEPESVFKPGYPPGQKEAGWFTLSPEIMGAYEADAA